MRKLTLWQAVAISTQFGVLLAVSVFIGFALGWLVDRWTGVGAISYLLGALLGMISGIYSVVRLVQGVLQATEPASGSSHQAQMEADQTEHSPPRSDHTR